MILVLAEKPAVARAIITALGWNAVWKNGYWDCGEYAVTYAFGHLLTLKMPEDYDIALKKWNMEQLPIYFPNWEKKPNPNRYGGDDKDGKKRETPEERLNLIGGLLKKAKMVIHAGDPDDEGRALIDEILEWWHYTGPVKCLRTGVTSPKALSQSFHDLDPHKPEIGKSAYARGIGDLMVGANLSRFYSVGNPGLLLTVGRVQSPTLGMVVELDMLIEGHKSITYYTIGATLDVSGSIVPATYQPKKDDPNLDDGRITDRGYAEKIREMAANIKNADATVTVTQETENPPLPFNLTELSLYCEKHFKYDPVQVLNITQVLRDKYNCITYNRTECQYLSSEQFQEAPAVMDCVVKNIKFKPQTMDMTIKSRAFDDSYVLGDGDVAHLAIIPQAVDVDISKMSEAERNVYLAICKYYMAQFMPPAIKKKTQLKLPTPDGGSLNSTSTHILSPGYRVIFKESEAPEESPLSLMNPGVYKTDVTDAEVREGTTKPPSRYTQAGLKKEMSRIARHVKDPKIKSLLLEKDKDHREENGSIGTEATRSSIIKGLLDHHLIEEDSKGKLKSTPLGRELYRILPKQLTQPDLTALWWCIQEDIKHGKATVETLTENVLAMINDIIAQPCPLVNMSIIPDSLKRSNGRMEVGTCPRCGKPVIEGNKGFGCTGYKEGCKFVIWKKSKRPMLAKVTFTANDAQKFLAGQAVLKKNLFSPKTGKTFEAYLVMKDDPSSPYGPSIDPDFSMKTPGFKKGAGSKAKTGTKKKVKK